MRWALITTVALSLTLYTGCKKDEEPSAENSEEQANSSEESEENNAPESEGEAEGEAEAATEEEAGTEAEGEAETEAATEEEAGTEAEGEATADAAVLTMPEGVIAIANVGSFDSVFNTVKTKATQYGFPLPITRNIVLEQLKGQLGLASMDWFATDKPIQAVILNPKVAGGNGVLLAPITGKDAVLAALPAAKETDVDGNDVALTIPGAGVKIYLNFVGDHVALTGDPSHFGPAEAFCTTLANRTVGSELLNVTFSIANLRTIFAAEIAMVRGQIDQLKPTLLAEIGNNTDMPPGIKEMFEPIIDFYLSMMNTVIDESQTASFQISLDTHGNIRLPWSVTATEAGKIAALAKTLSSADLAFTNKAPVNAWLITGGQIDPNAFDGLTNWAKDLLGTALSLNEEESAQINTHFDTMLRTQSGKSWTALYADGVFPLAIAGAATTTDGAAYHTAMVAYGDLILGKVMALATEHAPPQMQALLAGGDLPGLVSALNGITSAAGVTLEAKKTTEGALNTYSLSVTADVEKILQAAGPSNADNIRQVTRLFGNKLEMAMTFGPTAVGMAVGPNGIVTANKIANGQALGAGNNIASSMAAGTAAFMHLDLAEAVKAFTPMIRAFGDDDIPDLSSMIPAGTSMGGAIGAAENTVRFELYANLDAMVAAGKAIWEFQAKAEQAPEWEPASAPEEATPGDDAGAPSSDESDFVKAANALADGVCACTDKPCAQAKMQGFGQLAGQHAATAKPADGAKVGAAAQRAGACVTQIAQRAAGAVAAPPAAPAPAGTGGYGAASKAVADEVCACQDLPCAQAAIRKFAQLAQQNAGAATAADAQAVTAATRRAGGCMQRIVAAGNR